MLLIKWRECSISIQKTLLNWTRACPKLESLVNKPFEKDREIQQLKSELCSLERQVAVTIQEKQLKQNEAAKDAPGEAVPEQPGSPKEATIIPLKQNEANGNEQQLARANGIPVTEKSQEQRPVQKKNRGLKLS